MTLGQMVLGAFGEEFESRLPEKLAKSLKEADSDTGIVGLLHDLYCALPDGASFVFMLASQLIKGRGPAGLLFGEFLESIPTTSRDLRAAKGKTEESARADLIKFYENWKKEKKVSDPIKAVVEEKKVEEKKIVEEWETALARNFSDLIQRRTVRTIALICLEDSNPGNNYVFGTDAAARHCRTAWFEATRNIPEQVKEGLNSGKCGNSSLLDKITEVSGFDPKSAGFDQKLATARKALFQNNAEAINTALTNYAAKHGDTGAGAGARDAMQALSNLAGFLPGGHGESVKKIFGFGVTTFSLSIVTVGLVMAYVMALLWMASTDTVAHPTLEWFAYFSMFVLMGLPIVGMVFGSLLTIRSAIVGLSVQTASFLLGLLVSPILIGTAFTFDAILPVETRWDAMVLGPVWVIGWALISIGLLQKAVNEVGFFGTFIVSVFGKEFAEDLKTKLANGQWLAKVADTIAYAVLLIWVVAVPLAKLQMDYGLSQETRLFIIGMVGVFGLLSVFMARSIVHGLGPGMKDQTIAQREANQKRDFGLVSKLQRSWVPLGLVVMALFLVVPALNVVKGMNDPTGLNVSGRVTTITKHVSEKSLDWVEKTTGTPATSSTVQTSGGNTVSNASVTPVTGSISAPVKAKKSKHERMCDSLSVTMRTEFGKVMTPAQVCAEHGQDFGPCPCN